MRLLLAGLIVFAVMATSAVVILALGLPTWLAATATIGLTGVVVVLVLRFLNRPVADLRGFRSPEEVVRELESADLLVDEEFQANRALQVQEFEDEGSTYLLSLDDGGVLCMTGQYLYEFEPGEDDDGQPTPRQFPNTRFVVRRHKQHGYVVDIQCAGTAFEPEAVVLPFTTEEYESGDVPSDGQILRTESFEALLNRLRSRPRGAA